MYLGDKKVKSIEWCKVVLESGELNIPETAQKYLITDKECTPEEYYTNIDKKIISEFFEVIKNIDINKLLLDEKQFAKELDQEFVNIAGEIIKCATEFDFPIERLWVGFRFIKWVLDKINTLTINNLTSIEDQILIKALKLENEWTTDDMRMRHRRISHLIENLKNNS